jgi:hypothetical protein
MSIPAGAQAVEPRPPKCPYCDKDMQIVVLYPYQVGNLIIPSIACPWCAVLLHIEIIRPDKPAAEPQEPPPPKSPIWKPS